MTTQSGGMSRQPSLSLTAETDYDGLSPDSLRPPSVILSPASSSSQSTSSSQSPSPSSPRPSFSPTLSSPRPSRLSSAPPPPPPSRFLFWPDPLPLPASSSGKPRFAFGWVTKATALVAGVLEADDRAAAERLLADVGVAYEGRRAMRGLRVIGSCSSPEGIGLGLNLGNSEGKGKGKAVVHEGAEEGELDQFPGWVDLEFSSEVTPPHITIIPLHDSPHSSQHLNSIHSPPFLNGHGGLTPSSLSSPTAPPPSRRPRPLPIVTVLYTPPSRSQLQFFSLTPLQLDLNSFSSRRPHRRRRSVSAVVAVAEQETQQAQSERAQLAAKLKRATRLDFASPTEGQVLTGGVVDLGEVVDWVSGAGTVGTGTPV